FSEPAYTPRSFFEAKKELDKLFAASTVASTIAGVVGSVVTQGLAESYSELGQIFSEYVFPAVTTVSDVSSAISFSKWAARELLAQDLAKLQYGSDVWIGGGYLWRPGEGAIKNIPYYGDDI
ncbi:MAG: hypothetical protein GYA51_14200, partial [Candidatus Methanofastidiosa archaeon]|nr:hypothetical protein [Candidatus Methanofastidiosa archaeon]